MFQADKLTEHADKVATQVESATTVAVKSVHESLSMFQQLQAKGISILIEYGPKVIVACLILWISLKIINFFCKRLTKILARRNVDVSLRPFIVSVTSIGLKILMIMSVVGIVGIPMTSFIALIGAMGLAIGMAFSGTLSNVAGGVVLLVLRPFKVGDTILAQGYEGTVKSIQIFTTILISADNKTISIPNGPLSTGPITNYSLMETRRLDINIKLAQGEEINSISKGILEILNQDGKILKNPTPEVLTNITDSSVTLSVRFWTSTQDYGLVGPIMHKNIYQFLYENKITPPYQKVVLEK